MPASFSFLRFNPDNSLSRHSGEGWNNAVWAKELFGFNLARWLILPAFGLCLAPPVQAISLEDWRTAVTATRQMGENDAQQACNEAQRLQAALPKNATLFDQARVLNVLARAETYAARVEAAAKHAQLAMNIATQSNDRIGQAEAQLNITLNAINQARVEASMAAATRSLELLEGADRPELLGEAMLRMAMMYRRLGDFDNSVTMAMQAMEIAKRSNNPYALAFAHQGMAISFEQSSRSKEALEHYQQMREHARAAASRFLEAHAMQGMATQMASLGEAAGAEKLMREAIVIFRALHTPFSLGFGLSGMANHLRQQGRYSEALTLMDEVIANYGKYPNRIGLWFALNGRSLDLQGLGRIKAARADAERAYALAKEIGAPVYLGGSARRLSEIAAVEGDYPRAYQFAVEAEKMASKTVQDKSSARIVELTQRYETESKQRKIDELILHNSQQDARQRWLWSVLAGVIVLLAITAFFFIRLRRSREEIRALNIGLELRVQERTAELRQQARYLRTLIDMLPMWAWFKDTQSRYLAVNQAAAEASGHTVQEMLGKSDLDVFPADVARAHHADDAEVMSSRQRKMVEEKVPRESSTVWMETYKAAVLDEDGTVLGTVGVARDISERKTVESAREAALAEAERLAKSRSEFLAQMSHELRTPLNGILGYAQILGRDKKLDERQLAGVNVIRQSGEHLLTLINDILDFAKIDAGKMVLDPGDIQPDKFLRTIAGIIRIKADEKHIEFACSPAPDLPAWIRVDEKRLRQVLLNLLSNAVKFTERGRVSLRANLLPSGRLRFEVQDTGIGIAGDQLEAIFQPFEQVGDKRHQSGGTGLGLPISRQIVRLMGGDIHVISKPGQGSTFWFELEAGVQAAGMAAPARKPGVTGYAGARKTILVVDDVAENRAVASEMLEQIGFRIIAACNGAEALEQVQAQRPDLILMDSVMQGMDGLEATRRLRRMPGCESLPVIALSASASGENETNCMAAGASAFLPKPVELTQLLAQIGWLLKLDWIYEQEDNAPADAPLIVPPVPEMENLYHLARTGNMRDILQSCDDIIETDGRYRPFAEQLRGMAQGYQTKAILSFIEQHMEGKTA